MEITDVRISLRDEPRLKAFVTVTFESCFVVRGIKVVDRPTGRFVAMPSHRKLDGSYQDIAHPIRREMRERMERRILAEYRAMLEQREPVIGVG
jgi:stage V sporulation protein G